MTVISVVSISMCTRVSSEVIMSSTNFRI